MPIKWTKTALRSEDEIAGDTAKDDPERISSFVFDLRDAVPSFSFIFNSKKLLLAISASPCK
ncbi:hypothetical protein B9Z40_11090 [Limnohabitans sp. 15K]|nr:hypothetical protein B9Z40_11090 [Limnohabitans sp. 15K]